jgi:Xaa-Pro dipeptidase
VTKQELGELFGRHLEDLSRRTGDALERCGFEALLIGAGEAPYAFRDDQTYPFRANPTFKHWVPLPEAAGSFVLFQPGRRPRLVFHKPDDFWHGAVALPDEPWVQRFDVVDVTSLAAVRSALPASLFRTAFIGEPFPQLSAWGIGGINPDHLLHRLDHARARKSAWELHCLRTANRIGAVGHAAARAAFFAGESEYGIHLAFLRACGLREQELPYNAIIALNEHGATLHHQTLDRIAPADVRSLVIDAGASFAGYGSDITRTWVREDSEFAALVTAMDTLQRRLCAELKPGVAWTHVHQRAVEGVAAVLHDAAIVRASPEAIIATGLARRFFPHGLGHLLGLQVHDVGGTLADESGRQAPRPPLDPALRLTRVLENDYVVTVEPGLYFIPALLGPARSATGAESVDWGRVERLTAFGGIRIEDDVRIVDGGCENLTRPALDAALRAA